MGTNNKRLAIGFTIVELIVVIAVIGILAAITVTSYNGWRKSIITSQLKSDLKFAATAMENSRNFGNTYPDDIPDTFDPSNGDILSGGGKDDGAGYCINATNSQFPDLHYFIDSVDSGKGAQLGDCPLISLTAIGNITGTPQIGTVLTRGNVTPTGASADYQWKISSSPDGTYSNISGVTSNTYTPVTGDVGKFLKVSATGKGSYTGTVTSAASAAVAPEPFIATGCTITYTNSSGTSPRNSPAYTDGYTVHTCTASTTFLVTSGSLTGAEVLLIGGGGAGGRAPCNSGGGAGGFLTGTVNLSGSMPVVIGAGGLAGYGYNPQDGGNSTFGGLTANGGGAGGFCGNGHYGGSGGGASDQNGSGGGSVSGQGHNGGVGGYTTGGGGGGAGAVGGNGVRDYFCPAGIGGVGLSSSITGNTVWYAGGGGGNATDTNCGGAGGSGGGGAGNGSAGSANTGGGGGAGTTVGIGGAGGSGVVIIRYLYNSAISAIAAISGTPAAGSTLAAGALTPSGATATYQWQNATSSGGTYTNISGATSSTYALTGGDVGKYIKVVATGRNGYTGTVTSTATSVVTTSPITAIAAIIGMPSLGSILTAGALTPSGATATYQWQSATSSGGTYTNISGATSSTYTLVSGDLNTYIKVVATGTGGFTGTVTSVATTVVTAIGGLYITGCPSSDGGGFRTLTCSSSGSLSVTGGGDIVITVDGAGGGGGGGGAQEDGQDGDGGGGGDASVLTYNGTSYTAGGGGGGMGGEGYGGNPGYGGDGGGGGGVGGVGGNWSAGGSGGYIANGLSGTVGAGSGGGGGGWGSRNDGYSGGSGGRVSGTISVISGYTITVVVGSGGGGGWGEEDGGGGTGGVVTVRYAL